MDSLTRAGNAILDAQEGNRQFAAALGQGLGALIRRLVRLALAALSATPGPHLLQ